MERRRVLQAQRRELLLVIVRYILVAIVVVAGYFIVRHVWTESNREIEEFSNRTTAEYMFIVEDQTRMLVVNDKGELSMEITGEEIKLTSDQKTALFTDANAIYYEDGEESLTMKAGQIEYDTDTEDFLLTGGLLITTKDGMTVTAEIVEWRRVKESAGLRPGVPRVPSFRFPEGVSVVSSDNNTLSARYMQADRELMYMEFIGDVHGDLAALDDTGFIQERDLTEVDELNLEDFESLAFQAEQVIYDKNNQVILATCREYDKSFEIINMDGKVVPVEDYQDTPTRVAFSKKEININCDHLEAHLDKKWAACVGRIDILIPPAEPEAGDDRSLKVVKQHETRIATSEVEYFWGRDYILTHGRTRVEQEDRLALADRITYWGDKKMVLLDENIVMVQGSGDWLVDEELVEVGDHDMRRAVTSYSEVFANRAVVYLNNNDFIASGDVWLRQDDREVAADLIVYQDEIKRITADNNVKFRDKDGQGIVCGSLVFHSDSDFIEVSNGITADIRLPAKFANDINQTLAETRETEAPPEIIDPPVDGDSPERNPNDNSVIRGRVDVLPTREAPKEKVPEISSEGSTSDLPSLDIPEGDAPREIIIELGDETTEPPAEPPAGTPEGGEE